MLGLKGQVDDCADDISLRVPRKRYCLNACTCTTISFKKEGEQPCSIRVNIERVRYNKIQLLEVQGVKDERRPSMVFKPTCSMKMTATSTINRARCSKTHRKSGAATWHQTSSM